MFAEIEKIANLEGILWGGVPKSFIIFSPKNLSVTNP